VWLGFARAAMVAIRVVARVGRLVQAPHLIARRLQTPAVPQVRCRAKLVGLVVGTWSC